MSEELDALKAFAGWKDSPENATYVPLDLPAKKQKSKHTAEEVIICDWTLPHKYWSREAERLDAQDICDQKSVIYPDNPFWKDRNAVRDSIIAGYFKRPKDDE